MKAADTSGYEILFDRKEGEYQDAGIGGIRTKTIRAGEFLEVEAYPITHVSQEARRETKRRSSTPAQDTLNRRNAWKRMRRYLEANFTEQDYVMHPTFDYGFVDRAFSNLREIREEWERRKYPESEEDARVVFRNFIRRLKRRVKQLGGDPKALKYIYVIQTTKEPRDGDFNALPARYHYHCAVSGCGVLTVNDINECWDFGYTKAEPCDMRFNGLTGFAKYILRQDGKRASRWAHSKNLVDPEKTAVISDRKISRRRAAAVARDVQANGEEIFAALYPDYRLEEPPEVRFSDWIGGASIAARLRRIRR